MKIRKRIDDALQNHGIDGTEPIEEQLVKAGLLNKNRGRVKERWLNGINPSDFLIEDGDEFDIFTPSED